MTSVGSLLLPNVAAICLVAGLIVSIIARRPPRRLGPVLLLYQIFALLYLVGDAITLVSEQMWVEQLGIAILYSGAIPAASACWILAIRYAEAQGRPFPWANPWATRVPVGLAIFSWLFAVSNPWHGQFLEPVIGDNNVHLWGWWLCVPWGYGLVSATVALYGLLAWRETDVAARRNALLMAGAISVTVAFNATAYMPSLGLPFDLTVAGLGGASALFLYGAYRTQLFSLLPVAILEASRDDPDARILVDLEGLCLRRNSAAAKLLGGELLKPGRDVVSLLASRLRDGVGEPLDRAELSRRLLRGPRATRETVGALMVGEGHWVEITATPIPRSEGRARAISLRIEDVSARVALEEQLRRARRELRLQAEERRLVDRLLGEVLREVGLTFVELDQPRRAKRVLTRIWVKIERARAMTGSVVPRG